MTRLFDAKPFIIAEVGSNWLTLEHCIESIAIAKNCGADAVKFQAFTHEALYGKSCSHDQVDEGAECYDCGGKRSICRSCGRRVRAVGEENVKPHYFATDDMPHSLPIHWLPKLAEKAAACGIEFMCTAFSPELVGAVDPYVSVHKVASSDLSYPQLLQAVAKTRKPVLLSTGASGYADIVAALQELHSSDASSVVLMYCVSAYPARTVDLRVMACLETFGLDVGFSDHTFDIIGHPVAAADAGAIVIEKHFTAFPDLNTPDRPHSLTANDFKLMVDHIRGTRGPKIGPSPEERDMLVRHNRRLIATKDICVGTVLEYGKNFGSYRALEDDSRGLSPFAWLQANEKVATVAIAKGKGIGLGDFE